MCGIAGVLGLGEALSEGDRRVVREMTARLHHRGPNSAGFRDGARHAIGNSRLRVIDLREVADLPMASRSGDVWIAYNGEVTNFRELAAAHGLAGDLRTRSDTEVLLALYERLGIAFIEKLTGMFAFALVDEGRGKAWLVRDPYGIRPLFVARSPRRLWFGSEIKALLAAPGVSREVDLAGIYDFLSLAYVPGESTPFRDVREVLGGRVVEVELASGAQREWRYYEPTYRPDEGRSEASFASELMARMRDSVRRNLVSDAPLGLTLSGGFDTSSILALARELEPERDIHTFSIAMEEESFDESRWQQLMSERCRTVHHEIRVGPKDVAEALVEHMAFMDEPSGDGAAVPSYLMAREATNHVTVLLSGEGGDETFNAYETHLACRVRDLYRRAVPRPVRLAARHVAHRLPSDYRKLSFDFLAKRFTHGAELGAPEAHHFWRHSLRESDKRALLPAHASRPTAALFREVFDRLDYPDPLDRISVIDLEYYFIGDLMVKNDRTFMAHSLEGRFPFMDRELFDFVSTIPARLRIKLLTRRHMQKRAMTGRVPREILARTNMGLEMPHSLWFLDTLRPIAEDAFSPARVSRLGFLDPAAVQSLWQEHLARRRDNGRGLWCLLNLIVWHELFVQSDGFLEHLPRPN